jgi:putative spermidine/putrescine transport system substrate-binding protein
MCGETVDVHQHLQERMGGAMFKKQALSVGLFLCVVAGMYQVAFGQQAGSLAGRTLRVATWGGGWRDIRDKLVGQSLEKATGAKVEWVLGNPVDHLAKMIASKGGDPPFDVAEMGTIETVQARQLGLLDKLDTKLIPNIKNLDPVVASTVVGDDVVGFCAIEIVNAYIPSKLKELGVPAPTTVGELFNPKLAGKIALPFVGGSIMGPILMTTLAIDEGGSIDNIKPALERLKTAKVSYYYRASTELEMRMFAGEIHAGYMTIATPYRNRLAGRDFDYSPVAPKGKKASNSISTLVVLKGSKNRELANMYVNYSLGLDAQYGMAEWSGVRPVTQDALKKVLASSNPIVKRLGAVPWTDIFTTDSNHDAEVSARDLANWVDQFNREVGAK